MADSTLRSSLTLPTFCYPPLFVFEFSPSVLAYPGYRTFDISQMALAAARPANGTCFLLRPGTFLSHGCPLSFLVCCVLSVPTLTFKIHSFFFFVLSNPMEFRTFLPAFLPPFSPPLFPLPNLRWNCQINLSPLPNHRLRSVFAFPLRLLHRFFLRTPPVCHGVRTFVVRGLWTNCDVTSSRPSPPRSPVLSSLGPNHIPRSRSVCFNGLPSNIHNLQFLARCFLPPLLFFRLVFKPTLWPSQSPWFLLKLYTFPLFPTTGPPITLPLLVQVLLHPATP